MLKLIIARKTSGDKIQIYIIPTKTPECVSVAVSIIKENVASDLFQFVLYLKVGSFLRWIHESSVHLKERSFEQSSKVWSGMEIVGAMEKQGITPGTFYIYYVCYMFYLSSN